MSDVVIQVEGLGKRYTLHHEVRHETLSGRLTYALQAPARWLRRAPPHPGAGKEEFWALRDVHFEVRRGEVLGIVGRNGAGKSTLLKILSRITEPTTGRARIRGRVASLLEVGTGFHPELTGRENVFLNGAILGMTSAEIRRQFDAIVAFAEVEKFIDTPVKHFSSGMYVRLAFAVAAHLDPEILIVDEVLAVGDMQFQKKCLGKMQSVAANEGRTVLFVSHNTAAVQNLCTRAVVMVRGSLTFDGTVAEALQRYLDVGGGKSGTALSHQTAAADCPVKCQELTVNGQAGDQVGLTDTRLPLDVEMILETTARCRISLETYLCDRYGSRLAFCAPGNDGGENVQVLETGRHRLKAQVTLPMLMRGQYQLEFSLVDPFVCKYIGFPAAVELTVDSSGTSWGRMYEQAPVSVGHELLAGTVRLEPVA